MTSPSIPDQGKVQKMHIATIPDQGEAELKEKIARDIYTLITHGEKLTKYEHLAEDSRSYSIADYVVALIDQKCVEARIDEGKQFQRMLRGGKLPQVASIWNSRIEELKRQLTVPSPQTPEMTEGRNK